MATAEVNQPIVLQPHKRLDAMGGNVLRQQIEAIAAEEYKTWAIDLTQVDFVDSSGLFALVYGLRLAREQGCRLVLCGVRTTVRLIFEITQLDGVFEIFDSYDAFIQMLDREDKPSIKIDLAAA